MNASVELIEKAIAAFDRDLRSQPEWLGWVENQNYKYAIFHNGEIYPVKQVVSMATGLSKAEFSGGEQSSTLLTGLGFKILPIRAASWAIKSGKQAVKVLDKSAFMQGTGIPIEIRPFFIDKDIHEGEHRPISLELNGKSFSAYIAIESSPSKRTRLFWTKEFIAELAHRFSTHYKHAQEGIELDELPPAELIFNRGNSFGQFSLSLSEGDTSQKEWSELELRETVKAYLWMLQQETSGSPYNKADVNRKLREGVLSKRTKSSVEYRMQNISAVLDELCLPRIQGYLPAKNVGANAKAKLAELLQSLGAYSPDDYSPSDDQETLDNRVSNILKKGVRGKPAGQIAPSQTTTTTTTFSRDPLVKAWVLDNAKGVCEGCGSPAPFVKSDGQPFLEVHHVKMLADGGADTIENAVALCPNCHRRCHVSADREEYSASLCSVVSRIS